MLSPKQTEIATYGARHRRWTIVSGPMGSGKTHAACIGFLLWQRRFGNCELGILTKTRAQMNAVLKQNIERLLGIEIHKSAKDFLLPGANGTRNKVYCFVADNVGAEARLRSFNLAGMMIDEATTLPAGIIAAANARCRVGTNPKLLVLTNPDGPRHPLKTDYLDRAEEMNVEPIYTSIRDNPTVTQDYINSLNQSYSGHMRLRMVEGEWAAAEGLVYPHLLERLGDPNLDDMLVYDVAVDVGESSVTHALLAGRNAKGETWVIAECRHDHAKQGALEERDLVAKVRRAFAAYPVTTWIVDPAAKSFRVELEQQLGGVGVVGKAENDFIEGVNEVNHWVAQEALYLYESGVPYLCREIEALSWDPKAALQGVDQPIKTPDHGTDALRYLVFTRAVHEAGGRKYWERRG